MSGGKRVDNPSKEPERHDGAAELPEAGLAGIWTLIANISLSDVTLEDGPFEIVPGEESSPPPLVFRAVIQWIRSLRRGTVCVTRGWPAQHRLAGRFGPEHRSRRGEPLDKAPPGDHVGRAGHDPGPTGGAQRLAVDGDDCPASPCLYLRPERPAERMVRSASWTIPA